jgi:hypothetical protein
VPLIVPYKVDCPASLSAVNFICPIASPSAGEAESLAISNIPPEELSASVEVKIS